MLSMLVFVIQIFIKSVKNGGQPSSLWFPATKSQELLCMSEKMWLDSKLETEQALDAWLTLVATVINVTTLMSSTAQRESVFILTTLHTGLKNTKAKETNQLMVDIQNTSLSTKDLCSIFLKTLIWLPQLLFSVLVSLFTHQWSTLDSKPDNTSVLWEWEA